MVTTSNGKDGNDVSATTLTYDAMYERWRLPLALMGGTYAMRGEGRLYLPQEPGESDPAYTNRLNRTFLFNGFKRAVSTLVGKPFSKAVKLSEDTNEQINEWADNIDNAGRSLTTFSADVLENAMECGLSHILVDFPSLDPEFTLADARAVGARPYFVHVKAQDVIGWRSEMIAGVETLSQVRIKEVRSVEDGEFGETDETYIRVIYPDRSQVWQSDDDGNYAQVGEDVPNTLGFIPLITIYTGREGFMVATSPIDDLAWLNLAHWQSSSDQRHVLHVARVPILFGKMLDRAEDGGQVVVGPNKLIEADDPAADLKYVEHGGNAITAGENDLQALEDRMSVMGFDLLVQAPGGQTATEKAIDTAQADSALQAIVRNMENSLNKALEIMGQWVGITETGKVDINQDFGLSHNDGVSIDALLKARLAGELSRETFLFEIKRRGVLSDSLDIEDEQERIDQDAPDIPPLELVADNEEIEDEQGAV